MVAFFISQTILTIVELSLCIFLSQIRAVWTKVPKDELNMNFLFSASFYWLSSLCFIVPTNKCWSCHQCHIITKTTTFTCVVLSSFHGFGFLLGCFSPLPSQCVRIASDKSTLSGQCRVLAISQGHILDKLMVVVIIASSRHVTF